MFGDDVFCLFHMHIILLYLWAAPSGTQAEENVQLFLYFHCKYVNNTINWSCGSIFFSFFAHAFCWATLKEDLVQSNNLIKKIEKQDYEEVKRKK